jgi:ABC-type Fe3+/spermidine/putrescine transport system ATPase subunit
MVNITLSHVGKVFGKTPAVRDVSLTIDSGTFLFLVGPSGCGKTTILRMIAGLETPTSGSIFFDTTEVTTTPIEQRNVGFVFQQYALWPHMTVEQNILFGLKQRPLAPEVRTERLEDVLALTQLDSYRGRFPESLSGGQQQRVALARALALKPSVMLFDEPLSNLDPHLRKEIRSELYALHHSKKIAATMIYVTHDTEEALSMADSIAVVAGGEIQQVGSPQELYNTPISSFVANFLGEASIISGPVQHDSAGFFLSWGDERLGLGKEERWSKGQTVKVMIRPESFVFIPDDATEAITGIVQRKTYLGAHYEIALTPRAGTNQEHITIHIPSRHSEPPAVGELFTAHYRSRSLAYLT